MEHHDLGRIRVAGDMYNHQITVGVQSTSNTVRDLPMLLNANRIETHPSVCSEESNTAARASTQPSLGDRVHYASVMEADERGEHQSARA
jgi:hypothetical protein